MDQVALLYFGLAYCLIVMLTAVVFGAVPAFGSPSGGWGWGNIAFRRTNPGSFWMCLGLHVYVMLGLLTASDVLGMVPGMSQLLGMSKPLAGF